MTKQVNCPICDTEVSLNSDVSEAEIITCDSCSNRLEVKKAHNSFSLVQAPQIEEDWGE